MRNAKPKDIVNFITASKSCRRVDIVTYMTEEIKKNGKISSISESTTDKWLVGLKANKQIKQSRYNKLYSIPKPKNTKLKTQKNILKPHKENVTQLKNTQEEKNNTAVDFTAAAKEDAMIAESMQDTVFLLDSAIHLLDAASTAHTNDISTKKTKDEPRYLCRIFKESIKKIINEKFLHLLEEWPSHNRYQESIEQAYKQYPEKQMSHHGEIRFSRIADFRSVLSDVILQMRQSCEDNCKKFVRHDTHDKDAIYTSCKLVAISINEMCRHDYDLVVDSYEYDDKIGMFTIDISELKMISPYDITQVYCNRKACIFDINSEKESDSQPLQSDYQLSFYPDGPVSDDSIHTISIMLQCAEFSYVINGKKQDAEFTFLDHIQNDVIAQSDRIYPQHTSNIVMLTVKMGGKIKEIIESHYNKRFKCPYCFGKHQCYRWLGECHSDGISDMNNKKYSMMIKCQNSVNNYVSLHKIQDRVIKG